MHGTHGDLARGHGHLREELGHIGQEAFERSGGNGSPNQPLDDRGIGGVKGMEIGIRFPCFKQEFGLPDASGKIDLVPPQGYELHWGCPEEPLQKGARSRYPPPLQ